MPNLAQLFNSFCKVSNCSLTLIKVCSLVCNSSLIPFRFNNCHSTFEALSNLVQSLNSRFKLFNRSLRSKFSWEKVFSFFSILSALPCLSNSSLADS
ncbi:hypothetical protein A6V39_04615 [Candidatus Mycoplasma haematobovis]|uniref:Uncharacterized protein n=1 Tax=Candidatus Mycoplasma haematobovis TaxID=432608 RepID=A0A1A9QCG8_9MOLU|nr:hypothetical protein A6V39_04615 [Candidatus Mycoplasma haematobovis]